jgi:pilus assembly protein CpaB
LSKRVRFGILIGVVGIALAAFGIFFMNRLFQATLAAPLPQVSQPAPVTKEVVVTTHNIALGTVLKAQDLKTAEMPVELVPSGVLTSADEAVGRFSKVDLVSGEMLLDHHLADPTNVNHDVAYTIGDDQVMMAFPATDLMSSLGIIQRGDLVDIFITRDQEIPLSPLTNGQISATGEDQTNTETITFDAMQRVEITALVAEVVQEKQGSSVPLQNGEDTQTTQQQTQTKIKAYLLAMNPQDALVLKHFKDTGANFDFVLRSPTSNQLFDFTPVTSKYLIDRYQFVEVETP